MTTRRTIAVLDSVHSVDGLPETTTIPEKLSAVLAARPWLTGRDVYELLRGPLAEEGQS
jgi:hypothetical protein